MQENFRNLRPVTVPRQVCNPAGLICMYVHSIISMLSVLVDNNVTEPIFMMPFPKNENFIGRKDILKRLEGLLNPGPRSPSTNNQSRRAAIYGLGGIG